MNSTKNNYQKIPRNKQRRFRFSVFGQGPYFDWLLLLAFFLTMLIVVNIFTYVRHNDPLGHFQTQDQETEVYGNELKREDIESLLEKYKSRERVLNNFE